MQYIAVVLLSVGMLVASTATDSVVSAQGTKKEKDTGHIEIGKGKDGKYRFTVRTADDKFLALSAAYATEKEAREAIEAFRKVVANAKVTIKGAKPTK